MKVKNTVTRNQHSLRRTQAKYRYYSLTIPVFSSDAAQPQEVWCEEDRKSKNRIFQLKRNTAVEQVDKCVCCS